MTSFLRCSTICLLINVMFLIWPGTALTAFANDGPAVLICSPQGAWKGHVDIDWLRQLHEAGLQPDYLDSHHDFSWDRIKQYNCLVLYGAPAADAKKAWGFPSTGPRLAEYRQTIDRFLEAGGGVFMMVDPFNADQDVKPLIAPWGARVPYERYVETDPNKLALMPRMRGYEQISLVDQVLPSPISEGVETLWLPYGERYSSSWSAPIVVNDKWQVVVKGAATSRAEPVDEAKASHAFPKQADAVVRPDGVAAPALIAIRPYKRGRIVFLAQGPQFSIGQGTQWLYNRRVLSRGINDIPSDFEKLVTNALHWLSEPSLKSRRVGGYKTEPMRLMAPNARPGVKEEFEQTFWSEEELDLHRPPRGGTVFRGLIGARTQLGGGEGSVKDYAKAAYEAGLDFIVFMEPYAELTPAEYDKLQDECKRLSSEQLLLVPGYSIDVNTGNHMFFCGFDLPLPRANVLTGPKRQTLMLQHQDAKGNFIKGPNTYLQWVLYELDRYGGHMVGYYLFDDPTGLKVTDLSLSSAVAVKTYRDGELVDEQVDEYLRSTAGTLPSLPVAVNLVDSPAKLIEAVKADQALTYAKGRNLLELTKDALRWNSQYDGMNVFASDGPIIQAWPQCYRAYTYGAEPFVVNAELMPSELHITSDVGLREIRVMNGDRMIRRFLPNGAREFHQILHLPGNVQKTMSVVAIDVEGDQAVSFSRRCWRPGAFGVSFCGDHVNDCGRQYLARGYGIFRTHRFPEFDGGFTWDGGPKGERPVVRLNQNHPSLISDLGEEGPGLNQIPVMEFGDDQAVVVRSIVEEAFDPRIPPLNAWYTFAPKGPSRLMECVKTYTEFNRPLIGPRATGWAAQADRSGAVLANYANTIRFKQKQTVKKLQLLRSNWYRDLPAIFVAGKGKSHRSYYLGDGGRGFDVAINTGDWFGFYTHEAYNQVLFINRGDPIRVQIGSSGKGSFFIQVFADISGKTVQAGETFHCELFSVNEPLDAPSTGPERFYRVLAYLDSPDKLEVASGRRQNAFGFFELDVAAANRPVEIRLGRPDSRIGLTVPVRINGLNPNWSAGLYQLDGHTTGFYTNGKKVYTTLGFDFAGRVYTSLYPDQREQTHVMVGHPVVCDQQDLILEVMPRMDKKGNYLWRVAVNNPTDKAVTAVFRQALQAPGLNFAQQQRTVPAGGYVILQTP